jgi:hypothetical protein
VEEGQNQRPAHMTEKLNKEYMIKKNLIEIFNRVRPQYIKYQQSGKGNGSYNSVLATMSL